MNQQQKTGMAGELRVSAQLSRRDLDVALTFANTKAVDLFTLNPKSGETYPVQVKTLRRTNCFPIRYMKRLRPNPATVRSFFVPLFTFLVLGAVLSRAAESTANQRVREAANQRPRHTATSNSWAPRGMVLIPAGTFTMGDSYSQGDQASLWEGSTSERPRHEVFVSAFYMDIWEVGDINNRADGVLSWAVAHGYDIGGSGDLYKWPWFKCVKYCNARSEMAVPALTPCYTNRDGSVYKKGDFAGDCDWTANGYRLPTEAEWEKAARGLQSGRRFPSNPLRWPDDDTINHSLARYNNYSANGSSPYYPYDRGTVGFLTRDYGCVENDYGLFDVVGNDGEWCWDIFSPSYYRQLRERYGSSPVADPHGPSLGQGAGHALRGGCWSGPNGFFCRVSNRSNASPDGGNYFDGYRFRCCRRALDDTNGDSSKTRGQPTSSDVLPRPPRTKKRPALDSPDSVPLLSATVTPAQVDQLRVDAPQVEGQEITLPLTGRWKEPSGAELSLEDDGHSVAVKMVKNVGTISQLSGSLLWRDDASEPTRLSGTIEVVFRTDPGKTNTAEASITSDSPRTLRLRWKTVPEGSARRMVLGSYTLTKQE